MVPIGVCQHGVKSDYAFVDIDRSKNSDMKDRFSIVAVRPFWEEASGDVKKNLLSKGGKVTTAGGGGGAGAGGDAGNV